MRCCLADAVTGWRGLQQGIILWRFLYVMVAYSVDWEGEVNC